MPHDKNGQVLQAGDEVLVRMRVREVYPGADFCGVSLESVDGEQQFSLTCQAKQCTKDAPPERATEDPAPVDVDFEG